MTKDKKKRGMFLWIILLICIAAFAYSGFRLLQIWKNYHSNRVIQKEVNDLFFQDESSAAQKNSAKEKSQNNSLSERSVTEQSSEEEKIPEYDFTSLLEINSDVVGYLYIPALGISNVVARSYDNQYYLHRNIYGEYEYAGTVFEDFRSAFPETGNSVIYGHSMKDGTVLGPLYHYMEADFALQNPTFWYFTPEHAYRCEVISTFLTTTAEDYLRMYFEDENDLYEYMQERIRLSYVDFGVEIQKGDRYITLSTCNSSKDGEEGRQALYARVTCVD